MWRQLKDFVRAKKNSCDVWVVWNWKHFEKVDCLGCETWTSPTPPTPTFTWLCFTAEQDNSTVQLKKVRNPTVVNLEISVNLGRWTDYTIWDIITLASIWDKVYMRNKSETDTRFSTDQNNLYQFSMTWRIWASGDITSLLNKNWTDKLSAYCFYRLFQNCTSLTTSPELSATTLAIVCYWQMFYWCSNLMTLPKLPATTLLYACYWQMFRNCKKIQLSTRKGWSHQIEYRIPIEWVWSVVDYSLNDMFLNTWWAFRGTPIINKTYYTSNQVI